MLISCLIRIFYDQVRKALTLIGWCVRKVLIGWCVNKVLVGFVRVK